MAFSYICHELNHPVRATCSYIFRCLDFFPATSPHSSCYGASGELERKSKSAYHPNCSREHCNIRLMRSTTQGQAKGRPS